MTTLLTVHSPPPPPKIVPREELAAASQTAASLFFTHVFGTSGGVRAFNILIALSSFGNLLAVFLGQSRVLRECGRYVKNPGPPATSPACEPSDVRWGLAVL